MKKQDKQHKPLRTEIKHMAIMAAAKELFLKHGYAAISVDEIAQKASVSKRTIYDHFGNKQDLFTVVLQEHWSSILQIKGALFDMDNSIEINLKNFAHIFINFLYRQDTIDLFRLLIGEINKLPDLVNSILIKDKAPFTSKLVEFLELKTVSGELIIDNVERSASYFMGLLKEYHFWPMMLGFTQKKLEDKTKLIEEAVSVFLNQYQKK